MGGEMRAVEDAPHVSIRGYCKRFVNTFKYVMSNVMLTNDGILNCQERRYAASSWLDDERQRGTHTKGREGGMYECYTEEMWFA